MFIDAAQLNRVRAPSDASSMAIETAIRQQKEFEEALKLAQDRRQAEALAAERAKAEARRESAKREAVGTGDSDMPDTSSEVDTAEAKNPEHSRGIAIDVEV